MQEIRANPKQWRRFKGARHMVVAGAANLSVAPIAAMIGGFWVLGLLLAEGEGIPADEWAAPATFLALGGATLVAGGTLVAVGLTRRKRMLEPRVGAAPWGRRDRRGFALAVRF